MEARHACSGQIRSHPHYLRHGRGAIPRWCAETGTPPELTKTNAQAWIADLFDSGAQATTATTWLGGLKRFGAWLAEEDLYGNPPLQEPGDDWVDAFRPPDTGV
ncbi:MAG TPA: hypothetical protein VJ777_28255 [Mycobacterium sp.]|nr:hypothetical protein [Mycobacterium sp.]